MDKVIDDTITVENKAADQLLARDEISGGLLFHFEPAPRFDRYLDHPKKELPTSIGSPTRA